MRDFFLRVVHGFQNITVLFFYFLQPVYYQQRLLPLYNASFLFSKINIQWVIGKKTVPIDLSALLFQTALLLKTAAHFHHYYSTQYSKHFSETPTKHSYYRPTTIKVTRVARDEN